jgi:hypothetical protein
MKQEQDQYCSYCKELITGDYVVTKEGDVLHVDCYLEITRTLDDFEDYE